MALTKQTALKLFKVRDSKPLNYRQGPQMYTNAHILCSINTHLHGSPFTNVNANVMYVCMHNVEEHKEAHACKQTGVHAHRNTVSYAE